MGTDEMPPDEIEKRRDAAIKRALNTPPKPKDKPKDGQSKGSATKPSPKS